MIDLSDQLREYQALGESCGYHRFAQRTILEITGTDRVKFLHNFCTADIKKLESVRWSEAFITNVQGKTIGYVTVLLLENSIVLEGAAGQSEALIPHLNKYAILDDVEVFDRSGEWSSVVIAGPNAIVKYQNDSIGHMIHGDEQLVYARHPLLGRECYLMTGHLGDFEELLPDNAVQCGAEAIEMRRLEVGMPQFGTEVTDANLPQEVCRDAQAISFTKGCYLGQETVARIDALGHVNRYLKLVQFSGDKLPERGWEHAIDGKAVLTVTSAAYSPQLSAPIAFAYLRRGHEKVGTRFETNMGEVEVIPPPIETWFPESI